MQITNGFFPATHPNPGNSSWEISTDPGFLSSLDSVDGNAVFTAPAGSSFWHHWFAAGSCGRPANLGPYYVLWVRGMQTQPAPVLGTNGCSGETLLTAYANDKTTYTYWGFN